MRQFLLFILLVVNNQVNAQIISLEPPNPALDDTVTLTYDATQGNGQLAGYSGDVYMHAGLITMDSNSPSDWKYVVSDWCENTEKTKMTAIGNNLYQKEFVISQFYDIKEDERVLKLAFLFRSADCSKVGRTAENGDIFYNLEQAVSDLPDYESFWTANDTLFIATSAGNILITAYSANLVNIFSATTPENDKSHSTILNKTLQDVKIGRENNKLYYQTDSFRVEIDTTNLQFSMIYQNDTILKAKKCFEFADGGILSFDLQENEAIYGTGMRASEINQRGKVLDVYNQSRYGYTYGENTLNMTLPVVLSTAGYGLFIDNHQRGQWDIGVAENNEMRYLFRKGQSDIFIWAGNNQSQLIKSYTELTGTQPMPPIWALGYIQSKYGYETQNEAENIVNNLLNAGFPLDALVLDLYWFGSPGTMGNLDWDRERFPNPENMMADFEDKNVETILITEPYFTTQSSNFYTGNQAGFFAKNPSGETYIINGFWAGNSALLNMFDPAAQQWMWNFYKNRIFEGVSGWWTDLGEPENHPAEMIHYEGKTAAEIHNIYNLEWSRMLFENYNQDFPNRRFFNLTRSGYAGMQRYGTFPWSGDIERSFEGLRAQIPIMLSAGFTGIGYMHSDIGGFVGGNQDDELYTRWVQMGAFAPVFRIHGTGIPTTPLAYSTQTQEIVRKYTKLRLELLPYNYTLAYENSVSGHPLARSMDFYNADNIDFININDQYYWGQNILVAPVLQAGITSRNVWLPEGEWFDYQTLEKYSGGTNYTMALDIGQIPVFVKAGGLIPTVPDMTNTADYSGQTLFVNYYPHTTVQNSEFIWYDDDKTEANPIATDNYDLVQFSSEFIAEEIQLAAKMTHVSAKKLQNERTFVYAIHRMAEKPSEVDYNQTLLPEAESYSEMLTTTNSWFYDLGKYRIYVNTSFSGNESKLSLQGIKTGTPELPNTIRTGEDLRASIYPNPTNERLNISFFSDYNPGPVGISIYNQLGQKCMEINSLDSTDKTVTLSVTHLKRGVYFLHIQMNNQQKILKWVKY